MSWWLTIMLLAKRRCIEMSGQGAPAVFDPMIAPVFSLKTAKNERTPIQNSRDLFFSLIQASENETILASAYDFLRSNFEQVNLHYESCFEADYAADSVQCLIGKPDIEALDITSEAKAGEVWLNYAPICLTELSWLPPLFETVSCREPLAVELTAMYLKLIEQGHSIAENRLVYLTFLQTLGVNLPALHTFGFAEYAGFADESFELAAVQLALSRFPRIYLPEILGFTLACCQAGNVAEMFLQAHGDNPFLPFLITGQQRRKQAVPGLIQAICRYLEQWPEQRQNLWQRIQCGYWLYRLLTVRLCRRIAERSHDEPSPRQAMHRLLQMLKTHAAGHHGNIRLGSKTLDEWFREQPFKSENFLASLLHSSWVDNAKPEQSRLLTLFEFNGPMFGVLNEDNKKIVKNWLIAELNSNNKSKKNRLGSLKSRTYPYGLKKIPSETDCLRGAFQPKWSSHGTLCRVDFAKLGPAKLFYYLINSDVYPGVLEPAKKTVNNILTRARLLSRLPFTRYSHEAFENYIDSLYRHEAAHYRPLDRKPKLARESYVWGIEQLAPTILTDGSWLQSTYRLEYFPSHKIASWLNAIYLDEIGNGKLEQNHPHIYCRLLESVGLDLPPVASEAFANYPGFVESAFDIPVYLMAIAKFSVPFIPELLGLNMAIELSGLGNQYLRLSQALRYWEIDSSIVDIHTSIDNLATGHAALAMQAIRSYLDDIAASAGKEAVDEHWRRIYTGFRSLQTAGIRFKFALIWRYFLLKPTAYNSNNNEQ